MNISDNDQLREQVDKLLSNWGYWCRDDWWHSLGYSQQPMFKDYRPPRPGKTKSTPVLDIVEAERANTAILAIGTSERTDGRVMLPFSLFEFIKACWAMGRNNERMARQFDCSERTIRRRKIRAMQSFWDEYQKILLETRKKAEKVVA